MTILTKAAVLEIKQLLWDGTTSQADIARIYGISQPTVSRIMSGKQYGNLQWPDGNTGPLPYPRLLENHIRRSTKLTKEDNNRPSIDTVLDLAAKVSERLIQEDDDNLIDILSNIPSPEGRRKSETARKPKKKITWDMIVSELGDKVPEQAAQTAVEILSGIDRKEWKNYIKTITNVAKQRGEIK